MQYLLIDSMSGIFTGLRIRSEYIEYAEYIEISLGTVHRCSLKKSFFSRFPVFHFSAGAVCGSGCDGRRGSPVLVLLGPWLVPVACECVSILALLQLLLCVLPALRTELLAKQGPPTGQGYTGRSRNSCIFYHHHGGCVNTLIWYLL